MPIAKMCESCCNGIALINLAHWFSCACPFTECIIKCWRLVYSWPFTGSLSFHFHQHIEIECVWMMITPILVQFISIFVNCKRPFAKKSLWNLDFYLNWIIDKLTTRWTVKSTPWVQRTMPCHVTSLHQLKSKSANKTVCSFQYLATHYIARDFQ